MESRTHRKETEENKEGAEGDHEFVERIPLCLCLRVSFVFLKIGHPGESQSVSQGFSGCCVSGELLPLPPSPTNGTTTTTQHTGTVLLWHVVVGPPSLSVIGAKNTEGEGLERVRHFITLFHESGTLWSV